MGRLQQKSTLFQIANEGTQLFLVHGFAASSYARENPVLILPCLQASDKPGTNIGEPFVIKINRILRGEHYA